MDISDKFLQLPKAVIASYYESPTQVIVQGSINIQTFEKQFKETITAAPLSAEKATHIAMQVTSKPLRSIQDSLK